MDANLSIPMLLLMAQQRDCIVYKDGSKRHLKLVGMLFDNVSAHQWLSAGSDDALMSSV